MEEEWNDGTTRASIAETLQAIREIHELIHEIMKLLFFVTLSLASFTTVLLGCWKLRAWFGL